ncbi:hypothetical protein [Paraburkholderia sp. GAS348]|uniref:hypothetical protein n=1 Tax=Paraburkholderia sp. GAS348 TaxID=3035132 RepID=UPI003D22F194
MTVRQASAPTTDKEIDRAALQGGEKRLHELFSSSNKDGPYTSMDAKCRLYPKLSFFFDGTNSWPCALYDPRGVYCDGEKYYAHSRDIDSDTPEIV